MTYVKQIIGALVAAIVCLGLAMAQDQAGAGDEKSKKASTSEQSMNMMAKPSPEMQKLVKTLAGSWTTSERFEASDMMPKGGAGRGRASYRPGPGGRS